MNNFGFALDAAWRVLAASLLFGAGLPALFAIGIRTLAWGVGGNVAVGNVRPHRSGKIIAALCFALVLGAVALGIAFIVASGMGMELTFRYGIPMFTRG